MLVIGNGESRKNVNIDQLPGAKVGCNAIYRDWHVDHLVCCDRKMILETLSKLDLGKTSLYTRKENLTMHKSFLPLPELPWTSDQRIDQPMHWGSGPYAVLLASRLAAIGETIKLLGFDLYGVDELTNNVYKDTPNYKGSKDRAVDPRYWIYQMAKCFEHFPQHQYVVYSRENFMVPREWNQANLSFEPLTKLC